MGGFGRCVVMCGLCLNLWLYVRGVRSWSGNASSNRLEGPPSSDASQTVIGVIGDPQRSELNLTQRIFEILCTSLEDVDFLLSSLDLPPQQLWYVNVNTTDATTGATALLLPAQNTHTLHDPIRNPEHARARARWRR